MSKLALKLIIENKARHARGEDAKVLDLGNCGLTEVPEEVGELVWLEGLDLSDKYRGEGIGNNNGLPNRIKILKAITGLTKLKYLNCSSSEIEDLTAVASLINLRYLFCLNSKLRNLSPLKDLFNLEQLDCSSSQVGNLEPLTNLKNLRSLYCSNSNVKDISPLKGLLNLQRLDFSLSLVDDLSPLANLDKIIELNLYRSNVTDLSPLIKLIVKGLPVKDGWQDKSNSIFIYSCPIVTPPKEVIYQGSKAILRYFDEREKSGTDQIHEAKLLIIGEGGVGKTTLRQKLFDPTAPLPQEKDRTRGIDIQPLYFDVPGIEGKQFRLNIWDFAGQGKYQPANSFFYTHRSLYVLVDDTRTLNENDAYRTLYNNWLQTTELFGGKSPVLVLHNEKDDCARTGFSLGSFQERFDFVHGELFRINLGGGDIAKISDLRLQIERQALILPHIGDTVPKTWVKVREALEAERQVHPYISTERYRELCIAQDITDIDKQSDLSHYFHDLGVFLHFQDNPLLRRDVFLQNQWVTDAVYKILDDAQIASEQRGRFNKKDLARLWYESTYSDRRDELVALMLQFELCYQVQETETYICPQLLPGDVPTYDLGADIPLQLKYEYVFMPKGLFYRLIVRLHRHISQTQTAVWNSGVVLERANANAEIIESLDRRTISVRATGLRAQELVTIIHDALEGLHEPFGERLKVTIRIPCNCRVCKMNDKPHFYDKADLDTRMIKGKATVECSVSYDDVLVKGLLEGVFSKKTIPGFNDKLKLFISYSKYDRHHKDTLLKHLSGLRNEIVTWHDRDILPGENWDEHIKSALHEADVVLYLVTHNSLATEYIQTVELPLVEKRCVAGECILVPVIVDFCVWTELDFAKQNALPEKGVSVTDKRWANGNEAWMKVVEGVQRILVARDVKTTAYI